MPVSAGTVGQYAQSQSIQGAKKLKVDFADTLGEITRPVQRFKGLRSIKARGTTSHISRLESLDVFMTCPFADYLGLDGAKCNAASRALCCRRTRTH